MAELITDPGFEDDSPLWVCATQGGGVAHKHFPGSPAHGGSYEGKTSTESPLSDTCYAGLHQVLADPTSVSSFQDIVGTLVWWLKRVAVAGGGEYRGEWRIKTFDGITTRWLSYWFDWGAIGDPLETGTHKYIVLTSSASPTVWTEYSRNFKSDYFGKFGATSHMVTEIDLLVYGKLTGDLGQDIRWDDNILESIYSRGANPGKFGSSLCVPYQGV